MAEGQPENGEVATAHDEEDLGIGDLSKCKKCGMVLPLDTDTIEKHLESECPGVVGYNDAVGMDSGGGGGGGVGLVKQKWFPGKHAKKIGAAVGQRIRTKSMTSSSTDAGAGGGSSRRYSFSASSPGEGREGGAGDDDRDDDNGGGKDKQEEQEEQEEEDKGYAYECYDNESEGMGGKVFTPGSIVIDCVWENQSKKPKASTLWGNAIAAKKKLVSSSSSSSSASASSSLGSSSSSNSGTTGDGSGGGNSGSSGDGGGGGGSGGGGGGWGADGGGGGHDSLYTRTARGRPLFECAGS